LIELNGFGYLCSIKNHGLCRSSTPLIKMFTAIARRCRQVPISSRSLSLLAPHAPAQIQLSSSLDHDECNAAVYHGHEEVYHRLNRMSFQKVKMPELEKPTDIVVRILKTTICGTDLQILGGCVSTCEAQTRMGHEGIGEIIEIGRDVQNFKLGDRVMISCITGCGKCAFCKKKLYGRCIDGGWILGNTIDGTQGEFTRIPHADGSCFKVPEEIWDTDVEDMLVMCSDIMPSGMEVLSDPTVDKSNIALVGVGPLGLSSLIASSFLKPKRIFAIDKNPLRLELAKEIKNLTRGLENTDLHLINNVDNSAVDEIHEITKGEGVGHVVEGIGTPAGWYISQDIVQNGGSIELIGIHGLPVTLNLERIAYHNFKVTSGSVHGYSIPYLMKKILKGELDTTSLMISHKLPMSQLHLAYQMFNDAFDFNTVKVLLTNDL